MSGLGKINLAALLFASVLVQPALVARADSLLPMPTLPAPTERTMPDGPLGIPAINPAAPALTPATLGPAIGVQNGYNPGGLMVPAFGPPTATAVTPPTLTIVPAIGVPTGLINLGMIPAKLAVPKAKPTALSSHAKAHASHAKAHGSTK